MPAGYWCSLPRFCLFVCLFVCLFSFLSWQVLNHHRRQTVPFLALDNWASVKRTCAVWGERASLLSTKGCVTLALLRPRAFAWCWAQRKGLFCSLLSSWLCLFQALLSSQLSCFTNSLCLHGTIELLKPFSYFICIMNQTIPLLCVFSPEHSKRRRVDLQTARWRQQEDNITSWNAHRAHEHTG